MLNSDSYSFNSPSTFSSAGQLTEVTRLIHDESGDGPVTFDKNSQILTIPFRRIFHRRSPKIKGFWIIFWIKEVPVLRCLLQIAHVESVPSALIGQTLDELDKITYDEKSGSLIIEQRQDSELTIKVQQLSLTYLEREFRGREKIIEGLFGNMNSNRIYDEEWRITNASI